MTSDTAPTATGRRSPAPDLARGLMLLAIAVAHVPIFLADWGAGPLDTAALFLGTLLTENQARVLFVLLFGYGVGQLYARETARGREWPDIRSLLRRRGLVLLVIGLAHSVLLAPIDIVAVYGAALLLAAPLARAGTGTLRGVGFTLLLPGVLIISASVVATRLAGIPPTLVHLMADDPIGHVVSNFQWWWPAETLVSVTGVIPAMALGIWASRLRVLDEPERHRDLLVRSAVLLPAIALAGRLPYTLVAVGAWPTDSPALLHTLAALHVLTGLAGGVGAAALIGLLALRPTDGPAATAVIALGRRSLTFYLFQSVVFVALFHPFTLALADDLGLAAGLAVAFGIWVLSVALAEWMRRTGRRGPAEVLLRRLADRPRRDTAAA